jgi:hypothetical protein
MNLNRGQRIGRNGSIGCADIQSFMARALALAVAIAAIAGISAVHAAEPAPMPTAPAAVDATPAPPADAPPAAALQSAEPPPGFVRLPGHVLDALTGATRIAAARAQKPRAGKTRTPEMTLTLVLKRDHQAEFDQYLKNVYDPNSAQYRHFLTSSQIAQRFGPSSQDYEQVLSYLRGQHLKLVQGSKNRLTLTVRGTRAQTERAFGLRINDYAIDAQRFYANEQDPLLPRGVASRIASISGLSNLATAQAARQKVLVICGVNQYVASSFGGFVANLLGLGELTTFVTAFAPAFGELLQYGAVLSEGASAAAGGGILVLGVAGVCAITKDYDAFAKKAPGLTGGPGDWNNYFHSKFPPVSAGGIKGVNPRLKAQGATSSALGYPDGTGQTIGLVEFDTFNTSDVSDFINFISLLGGNAGQIDNLSVKPVNGGVATPGSGEGEVLLDIDEVMSIAPGAKVAVYDAPFNGQAGSYTAVFNAMINDGVTVISNSWASCEDQVSLAEAQGIDTVLQTAAASGISVFNGTGDSGSTCLDGSANTVAVPADSPNAVAVGGTSLTVGPGHTYGSETWWDGSQATPATGQGGYGVSKYFSTPAYQNGLNAAGMRSVPDVAASADPASNGFAICQADEGGCPSGYLNGGTSRSTPEWAAFAALLNQSLGTRLGALNPHMYPFANTSAFHSAASMGSDFAHVGLGSPNLDALYLKLGKGAAGAVDPGQSNMTVVVQPTTFQTVGTTIAIPDDGSATGGGVLVELEDANGNTIGGKTVTLTASGGAATISPASAVTSVENGTALFTVSDLSAETVSFTATDTTDGIQLSQPVSVTFDVAPAASGGISANPASVAADGQTAATVVVTLTDSLNRPAPGKTVTLSNGGSHAVVTGPTPSVTGANGQIQFSVTDQVNETVTFTAIDVTDANQAVPGSGTVTYSGATSTACGVGVAPVAGPGFVFTPYITGLPAAPNLFYNNTNLGCAGANNPSFTSAGTILESDGETGAIYQLGRNGGAASNANLLATLNPALGPFIYGKDGSVYTAESGEGGSIVQIDPGTGAELRTVAGGLTCPAGLAIDPLSGDLFFDDECTGGGTDDATVYRIIDPANSDPSRPTSVVPYATLPNTPNGGMAFAPNGTLYAVSGYYHSITAPVEAVSGTNAATVTVTTVTGITSDFAVAIGATNADGSAQSLIVEPAGTLSEVPIANPGAAVVLGTGGPGVGVTGPDGCLYSAHYDTVYRLSNSDGTCAFAPTSPAPAIKLTPASVTPNPAQGSSQTFTATLANVSPASGVPVYFYVAGANPQTALVDTDANGVATFSYTAAQAGNDFVTAQATGNSTALASNTVKVTWVAGKHVTFLGLNTSPQGGTVNVPVTVVASLADASMTPAAVIAGQSVTFTLGGGTCTATTSSTGIAACALTPAQAGAATLTAAFAGTSTQTASSASATFNVSVAPTPPPTVSIAVSPTSIAAGTPATLTWSSTGATTCAASGAWSGTQTTGGTQTVTPASTGSYSYTLTCTGNGGSASASATLAATLVAVTVTAHSGGGAMTWPVLLGLGLLVLLRLRAGHGARGPAGPGLAGPGQAACLVFFCLAATAGGFSRADASAEAPATSPPATPAPAAEATAGGASWVDPFYVGIRFGSLATHSNAGNLDRSLADRGYPGVEADTSESKPGGTLYVGYELAPHADVEFGYTHRSANVATLNATVASAANVTPLLKDTADLIRGYGNLFSLELRPRVEIAPGLMLDPRVGGFFWDTQVSAQAAGVRVDATHEGGGATAGIGLAYRVWRGLEAGIGVDYFRGIPDNTGLLYGGSLEWRFGR